MEAWLEGLGESMAGSLRVAAERWDATDGTRRLWGKDPSLWTGGDEARWLGWLDGPRTSHETLDALTAFAARVREDGLTDVLLLGMGGSSLCPEVLGETFGILPGGLRLHVLDSTDPAQVQSTVGAVDLARILVVVASKSGSTLEPNIFHAHVRDRMRAAVGREHAGRHFVAITDPGSKLERVAGDEGFRRVFTGDPEVGGRYSALSPFGLVPAALIGLDLRRWIRAAGAMADRCGPARKVRDNPAARLGLILGTAANEGRDKLTLIVSPRIYDFGAWLEQLVAESTGKNGKAIIPVDREPAGPPGVYGADRLFVYVRLASETDSAQEASVAALQRSGHPVVRLDLDAPDQLAGEFFRWEVATAVAGAIMGINPFDQPDVEASKIETRKLTDDVERTGKLPEEPPSLEDGGLRFFTDAANARALQREAGSPAASEWIRAHLTRLGPGDYFALLAYLPMTAAHETVLQRLRARVRDARRVATCLGFGPRFLHSTGQAYKGGPASGVFLQITCEDADDVPVPGTGYTFGVVKAAQARGDFQVLVTRGRRALRVHLGRDVASGLEALDRLVEGALEREG